MCIGEIVDLPHNQRWRNEGGMQTDNYLFRAEVQHTQWPHLSLFGVLCCMSVHLSKKVDPTKTGKLFLKGTLLLNLLDTNFCSVSTANESPCDLVIFEWKQLSLY